MSFHQKSQLLKFLHVFMTVFLRKINFSAVFVYTITLKSKVLNKLYIYMYNLWKTFDGNFTVCTVHTVHVCVYTVLSFLVSTVHCNNVDMYKSKGLQLWSQFFIFCPRFSGFFYLPVSICFWFHFCMSIAARMLRVRCTLYHVLYKQVHLMTVLAAKVFDCCVEWIE